MNKEEAQLIRSALGDDQTSFDYIERCEPALFLPKFGVFSIFQYHSVLISGLCCSITIGLNNARGKLEIVLELA